MKEIEILVEVYDDENTIIERFNKFKYVGTKNVVDEYYYDPLRKNLKPDINNQINECLRIRKSDNIYSITYKDDQFDEQGKWLYSKEYETEIDSYENMILIFEKLGLKKILTIENNKRIYEFNDYEIVLEKVKDLGMFIEVEYCTDEEVNVLKVKQAIQKFINSLNLKVSSELNSGKPEMLIRKKILQSNNGKF
jgi:predicted adenylyl cyclase CyaB